MVDDLTYEVRTYLKGEGWPRSERTFATREGAVKHMERSRSGADVLRVMLFRIEGHSQLGPVRVLEAEADPIKQRPRHSRDTNG